MPLDATNFYPKGPVKSADMRQFYDVLTGVMTDQPVTYRNVVTIGGNQGVTTIPLKVYGAVGQQTNLIDLYTDRTAPQPGFGFSALGSLAWGPGGAAPQDTFMSRIGMQNGHSSDTAGLYLNPGLEVEGPARMEGGLTVVGGLVADSLSVGAGSMESLYAGSRINTGTNYTVASAISFVFCTAAITVTLPAAASTNRPITVAAVTGNSTVSSAGGSIFGGSTNQTTGAITNGSVVQGDAFTYKSDGTNWRAV